MKTRNLLIVSSILVATLSAFIWGGYHVLMPTKFLAGLALASSTCLWATQWVEERELLIQSSVTLLIAWVDEYVHTTAHVFQYLDGLEPSPFSVFGWGLLVLGITTVSKLLRGRFGFMKGEKYVRLVPVVVVTSALILSAWIQGYLLMNNLSLTAMYTLFVTSSAVYCYRHPLDWVVSLMLCGVGFGGLMELIGGVEGMWTYSLSWPFGLFIAFTWALRVWTILAASDAIGSLLPQS